MIDLPLNQKEIADEIAEKIETFAANMETQITDREMYWKMYRGTPYLAYKDPRKDMGLAQIAVPITSDAVETLCNAIYSMLTAADPNFELVDLSGKVNSSLLFKNTQLLRQQNKWVKKNRKLMILIRSMVLNGSAFFEEPFVSWPPGDPNPAWEATDMVPRPLYQMFWSPNASRLEYSDYMGTLDIVSKTQLKALAGADAEGMAWTQDGIKDVFLLSESEEFISNKTRERLNALGYTDLKNCMELATYWGPLESAGADRDWVVGLVNRKYIVRFHPSPYPRGMRPFGYSHHIELDNDPLGIGVGQQVKDQSRWINSNLNRVIDTNTFALFNMMLVSKYAGIDPHKMKIKPWNLIEGDDISENAVRPLKPQMEGIVAGLKLHELLIEQVRNQTGATPTLQAVITQASASEVRIAQTNSMRRVANEAEIVAEDFIGTHQSHAQYNNYLFTDRPIWLRTVGMEKPIQLWPGEVLRDVMPVPRLVTDKDFAPQMIKNSLSLLQILTSVRNMIPKNVDVTPIVEELTRRLGIDPGRVFTPFAPQPPMNPQALMGMMTKERGMAGPPASPAEQFIGAQGGLNAIG